MLLWYCQWAHEIIATIFGENQVRAPRQASDYTLRPPNPLDSSTHDQTFYQDFGPPVQSEPQALLIVSIPASELSVI